MSRIDWGSFSTDILSVVLGIFITFGIQGLIDRRHEKKEVMAALELVKEELINNNINLCDAIGIISSEKSAAESISKNISSLQKCDADSVIAWNAILGNEYFFTITDDALELLKSSSLFQKINDKSLALSIIKAYDYLEADAKGFNTHEQYKVSLYLDANTSKVRKASLSSSGPAYLKTFYSTPEADYFLRSVIEMSDGSFLGAGISDIEATIADIDSRMK
ncbi:MAG: hypothetical protein Q4G10_01095 [Bacteroidia bacterium]|nr:hypothetical protein [Bacteroidia bacterium]